jgi:hypothetical protein
MDLQELCWEGMDLVLVAQNITHWSALVNTVVKLQVL